MIKKLVIGANVVLEEQNFTINVRCVPRNARLDTELDVSIFMLQRDGTVRNDGDFIFYNQPKSVDSSILLQAAKNSFDMDVNLSKVSDDVSKMVVVLSTFSSTGVKGLSSINLMIGENISFSIDTTQSSEKAWLLIALYRHKNNWKCRALGQSYQAGLASLAQHYGVQLSDEAEVLKEYPPGILHHAQSLVRLQKSSFNLSLLRFDIRWKYKPVDMIVEAFLLLRDEDDIVVDQSPLPIPHQFGRGYSLTGGSGSPSGTIDGAIQHPARKATGQRIDFLPAETPAHKLEIIVCAYMATERGCSLQDMKYIDLRLLDGSKKNIVSYVLKPTAAWREKNSILIAELSLQNSDWVFISRHQLLTADSQLDIVEHVSHKLSSG